jgi:hypothetical protein
VSLEQRASEREREKNTTTQNKIRGFQAFKFLFSLTLFCVIVSLSFSLSHSLLLAMRPELITTQKIFVYADLKKHLSFIFRLSLSLSLSLV